MYLHKSVGGVVKPVEKNWERGGYWTHDCVCHEHFKLNSQTLSYYLILDSLYAGYSFTTQENYSITIQIIQSKHLPILRP